MTTTPRKAPIGCGTRAVMVVLVWAFAYYVLREGPPALIIAACAAAVIFAFDN